tara:strand:+ start:2782 stop:3876 length:1095 start_codon:yes stop_codon:yes gene_type:complete
MSILYDEAQQSIANESRRVLEARVNKDELLPLLESTGQYHEPFWDTAKEQGWTALALPEEYDGLALGLVELGLIAHQAGRTLSGAPFLTSSFGVAKAIEIYGSDAQKQSWLPRLASGECIGAVAIASGASALPQQLQISFANDRIDGVATGVSAGLAADVVIVLAQGPSGPTLVVADLTDVERHAIDSFDNSRCVSNLYFNVTPAELLIDGPEAHAAALHILALQAVITAHEQTGGAEALMESARDYAVTRRAFGQVIGAFQSVKHRIAELYALVELARANCIHAASQEGAEDFIIAAAAARLSATEAYDTAARDCIQIHGGIGVTWEAGLHLHMRRARSLAIEQGNSLFWEDILVDSLIGEAA